jgi:hypothetical protein
LQRQAERLARRSNRNLKRASKRKAKAESQMMKEAAKREELAKMKHGGKVGDVVKTYASGGYVAGK